jgi:hypothetical protein
VVVGLDGTGNVKLNANVNLKFSDANSSVYFGDGTVQTTAYVATFANATPASANATGTKGQIAYDASYIYICVATDSWIRAARSSW